MSQTVGSNQVSTFTTPVNATSPIDANTVRGNDNTMKSAFNAHDADGGLHLQSSAESSKPTAGTAGRKWLATDTGALYLWFDTGSTWVEVNYLRNTGGTISGAISVTDATDATSISTGSIKTAGGVGVTKALWVGGLANIAGAVTLQSTLNVTGVITATAGVSGNASTATALATARAINGTNFDGTAGITVPVNNTDDTSTNATMYPLWTATAGGNYAAKVSTTKLSFNPSTGLLTATGFSGPLSGNASTATKLATARAINGVDFDGTAAITVTAAAGTLTGATLNATVTASSLTSVGTLTSLSVGAITTSGDFNLGSGKFTVAAASGNTVVAGTLGAGATTITTSGASVDTLTLVASSGRYASLTFKNVSTVKGYAIHDNNANELQIIAVSGQSVTLWGDNTKGLTIGTSGAVSIATTLSVTGTSTLTGNVGVGGASDAAFGLYLRSASLTGVSQAGVLAVPTFSSGATTAGWAMYSQVKTVASSFTMVAAAGLRVDASNVGSTSTITSLSGVSIGNQGMSGVTNAYGIYIEAQSGAATTNYAIYSAGGQVHLSLPTSSAGLASGSLWNDGGTVKVA